MKRHIPATEIDSLPWFFSGGGGGIRTFVLLFGSR